MEICKILLLNIVPIIMLLIGIIQTIYPEKTYMFGKRWLFTEESQLNDTAKVLVRIAGIIIIFISVWAIIKGINIELNE